MNKEEKGAVANMIDALLIRISALSDTPMLSATEIIKRHNHLRNDFNAYLYEVCNFGLGFRDDLPNPKDYGLGKNT
jgi:hypothetical protein